MYEEKKEVAEIRWRYLLRSDGYKEYCRRKRTEKRQKEKKTLVKTSNGAKIFLSSLSEFGYFPDSGNPFDKLFAKFGDVHSRSFDDYWKEEIARREVIKKIENIKASGFRKVIEYNIGKDIDYLISYHKEKTGRKLSTEELREVLIGFHNSNYKNHTNCLLISHDGTIKGINAAIKETGKLLKQKIKRFRKDEMIRYLNVYDMRLKQPQMTFREIQNHIYPNIPYNENIKRARINDYNKAEVIIKNVEHNERFYW